MAVCRLPLLPGTKVRRKILRGREYNLANTGVVQPYDTTTWTGEPIMTNVGGEFPVRWGNGFWETCSADDVTIVAASVREVEAA